MVKSHDIRDIVISHYKEGKKAREISNLLANKVHRSTILIVGCIGTNNLVQFMLNEIQEDQELAVQKDVFIL